MKTPRPFSAHTATATVVLLLTGVSFHPNATAQIPVPLDVTASQPIYGSDGVTLLPGSNPFAGSFGYPVIPGCLVQIIDAGLNGTADPPDHNGNPTGDDIVAATTTIGAGIAPDVTISGRFSTSIYPPPASGSHVYVRVFNATTSTAATYYGQSSLFTVSGVNVLDVSALGLSATTQPLDHTGPTLLAAVSSKTHGSAGTFDLNLNLDSAANPTVEPRLGGPNKIVFTFSEAVMATDGTLSANEFTLTNATFSSVSIAASNLTLNLASVIDQSRVTVVLNGLADPAGNPLVGTNAVRIRALYGDVNQSGSVSVSDLQAVKNKLLQPLGVGNFLADLNLSGGISVSDLQQVKNNLLHSITLGEAGGTMSVMRGAPLGGTTLSAPPVTLGEALGAPLLRWSSNGDTVWTPTVNLDGSPAAWSGPVGDYEVSWVETTVTGPGWVSFEWKVSSEWNGDWLTFAMDGVEQPGRISGEVDWQGAVFSVPAGVHRLSWTYGKNGDRAAGLDAGWLRRVSFTRSP